MTHRHARHTRHADIGTCLAARNGGASKGMSIGKRSAAPHNGGACKGMRIGSCLAAPHNGDASKGMSIGMCLAAPHMEALVKA